MIPFFDYRPEYRRLADELEQAARRVLGSGRLILGPEVEAFEHGFAAAAGVAGAVGVASGTDALILALRALDAAEGSEVVVPANAGPPPVAAIRASGATPVFVDVEADTLSLDAEAVRRALGPRTAAVVAVHLYGHPADLNALSDVTAAVGVPLIEDCAQAHGATLGGEPVGTRGVLGCYSFYPTKNLGAFGDGGAVVGSDDALLARVRSMRMYGFAGAERCSQVEGLNSRLDELQAALLRVKLPHLAAVNEERRALAARYDALLEGTALEPVRPRRAGLSAYHLYVTRCADRGAARQALDRHGIGHASHYEHAAHRMPAYRRFAGDPLPVTERACDSVLSLPLYPGLDDDVFARLERALAELAR